MPWRSWGSFQVCPHPHGSPGYLLHALFHVANISAERKKIIIEEISQGSGHQFIRKTAGQTLWELLASGPDFQLMGVDCWQVQRGKVIVATLQGFRQPTVDEIRNTKKNLQNRLEDPLIIRFTPGILMDQNGELLFGWTSHRILSPLISVVKQLLSDSGTMLFHPMP